MATHSVKAILSEIAKQIKVARKNDPGEKPVHHFALQLQGATAAGRRWRRGRRLLALLHTVLLLLLPKLHSLCLLLLQAPLARGGCLRLVHIAGASDTPSQGGIQHFVGVARLADGNDASRRRNACRVWWIEMPAAAAMSPHARSGGLSAIEDLGSRFPAS